MTRPSPPSAVSGRPAPAPGTAARRPTSRPSPKPSGSPCAATCPSTRSEEGAMLFALLVTYGAEIPSGELMQAHRDWLYPQYENGTFLLSGVLEPVDGRPRSALAILRAES